jgi:ATP-dependent helicase/nuclease subunit B
VTARQPSTIFSSAPPRLFTIDAGRAFLTDLASVLRASIDASTDTELADALIYLPTRRAVRALTEAFITAAPGAGASLLPRIRALGDIDEDEFVVFQGAGTDELDLPPAISAIERRLTLAQMVAAKDRAFDGQERWAGALSAADELGRLLDSFYTEEVSPDALETLVPEELAAHWRASLEFLTIITEIWPAYLSERGLMDPADRRVKLIDRQTAHWQASPPRHPVIIAGTTGSAPAVARMMKQVAQLPMGAVVLPGLDLTSDNRFWDSIDAPHPQAGLKQLLNELGADRQSVAPWPQTAATSPAAITARREVFSVALRPAATSDSWRDWAAAIKADRPALDAALSKVMLVEAADEEREADAAALKIRESLETPGKTVFLVTPDRDLSRRVAMKLRRWNINVDDSAGVPFANSPCGTYLRLVAQWLKDPSDAVALMAMARHPLFGGGLNGATRARAVNAMDRALRGLRPTGGDGLAQKINADKRNRPTAAPLLDKLLDGLKHWPSADAPFEKRLMAHLRIAEQFATFDGEAGAKRLWRGDDGEAGAIGLAPLQGAVAAITHDAPEDYAGIFDQLIAKITVRRRNDAHPRIAILGPLEARLQHADVIILGGLNDGAWPRDAAIDPFLSRPMRHDLGLPSPEQRIGLAAHDFAQLAAAPEIMLTRSTRASGKPTKPSRWIVRLKNILKGADALEPIEQSGLYNTLAQRLDAASEVQTISAPAPRPPVSARPRDFYVTRIEKLLRDPYAIYAGYILRLKKLDALNEPFASRHVGNLFHEVFKSFVVEGPPSIAAERLDRLNALYTEHAPQFGLTEAHAPFWRDRAGEALHWFSDWDAARTAIGKPVVVEDKGGWAFELGGFAYSLSARADRIDQLHDGGAYIIDYKSGARPTLTQTKKFSPQLPLTGLITVKGGFESLGATEVAGFEYTLIIGRKGDSSDDVNTDNKDPAQLVADAEDGLYELLQSFNNPDTAYLSQPRPQYMDDYGDYDHLARRRERNAAGAESDGGDE